MKTLILMQGVPGSGKSTLAKIVRESYGNEQPVVCSTDEFWYDGGNEYSDYNFDPERLREAHLWNQQRVAGEMYDGFHDVIIVDNCNITKQSAHPYIVLAEIFEYAVQVIRVEVPLEVAIARQQDRKEDRRVPEDVIRGMYERMETLLTP